jgi:hypothetical protein
MGHLIIYCNGLIVAARGWTAERRLCERCRAHRYYLSCGNRVSILRRVSCVACRLSSFCIRLHAGGSRPRSDFFVRCPAQKEYKATASFSPAEIKHMIGLPERLVGSFSVLAGNRNADAMPTSRLAFVENCIGSWLTERKCRGNGRSAGGGAALGSPACCDNRARDALGRKPRCSRATDHRGPPRAIIYNFRRMRPPRLELTQ